MNYQLYQILMLFAVYSFLGWVLEIVYHALSKGRYVNRGFLSGPYCPIYGFGVLLVLWILTPLRDNFYYLLFGSILLTSLLELITGFVMEKVFGTRWWDYSKEKLNIGGYVCLKFSVLWGLACLIVVNHINPIIESVIYVLPLWVSCIFLVIFYMVLLSDAIDTIDQMLHFKKEVAAIKEIAAKLKEQSQDIGENIADVTEKLSSHIYETIDNNKRILKAFPDFKKGAVKKMVEDIENEKRQEIKNFIEKKRQENHRLKKKA